MEYAKSDFISVHNAGVINVCHCLNLPELPLKGNYDSLKRFLAENTAVVEDIK